MQEKTFTHNLEKEMIDRVYGVEVAVDWVGQMDTTFTDRKFNFYSYWTTLDSESVKMFDSSGVEHLETSREFEYAPGLRQLRSTSETNSDSTKRVTEYIYAHEVTDNGTGKNYSAMAILNMLSQPYSITVMDTDSLVLAKNWTRWDNPGGVWRPKEEWALNPDTLGTNPTTGMAVKQMTWNSYDPYGNIEQFTEGIGFVTDLSWDATDNYYLEEIVQVNPDPIGANLIGIADYNNWGLLSRLIDQRGVETSYTYDGFSRLDSLLNASDDVIEDYLYTMNYSGGMYDDSNSNHIQTRSYTGSQTRTAKRKKGIIVSEDQWREFRKALDSTNVWSWKEYYDSDILDGTQWELVFKYGDASVSSGGNNNYPPEEEFKQFEAAVRQLLGGKDFG